jgi:microcystin-dependent protein
LTDSNATQSARHLRLNLTGTSGGAQNLVVPAIQKNYLVNNGTADTITVKTPSGSGIGVPSGKTMWVYNNGSNVVDAVTAVTSLQSDGGVTVDNLTIDGTEIDLSSGDLTLDVAGDIILDAAGDEVIFKDGSTNVGHVSMDSDNLTIKSLVSDKDVIFKGNDGGSEITALTLDMSAAGEAQFNAGITSPGTVTSSGTLAVTGNLTVDGASGTSGQVLTSAGSGATPTWGDAFVSGMIMLWSGSTGTIPSGWVICDGTNSTPDLRDRFVVGAGSTYSVDATGGSANATLVSHTHTATSSVTDPGHFHEIMQKLQGAFANNGAFIQPASTQISNSFTNNSATNTTGISVSTSVASAGSSATNANLPPYYALAYIMKT